MPRKNEKKSVAAIVPPVDKNVDEAGRMLVNKLSVKDARHLLRTEGDLDSSQAAIELIKIVVVAGLCAYAIRAGHATAWHLVLPMVGEYLALLVGIVVAFVVVRHRGMWKEARNSAILLTGIAVALTIAVTTRAHQHEVFWQTQLEGDAKKTWDWIAGYHMQWPMLAAAASVFLDLPIRVKNLLRHGPPFVAVRLGCGLRAAIVFMGIFIFPLIVTGSAIRNAWLLWGAILLAESLALWLHWDVQRRLRKLDGPDGGEAVKN